MDVPHFISSSADGHLHCFHILDIRNNATMIIHVTSFCADNIFSFFLVIYLGVEFPGHLISMFNLSSSCQIIFQCAASFYIAYSRIGSFSTSPPTSFAHDGWHVVVIITGFPSDWASCHMFIGHFYTCWEMCILILCPFFYYFSFYYWILRVHFFPFYGLSFVYGALWPS